MKNKSATPGRTVKWENVCPAQSLLNLLIGPHAHKRQVPGHPFPYQRASYPNPMPERCLSRAIRVTGICNTLKPGLKGRIKWRT